MQLYFYLIIGRYFSLLSTSIQTKIAPKIAAIGKPLLSCTIFVKNMPTITGKIINAPNALVLGWIINKPPTISVTPVNGISYPISIKADIAFTIFSGK